MGQCYQHRNYQDYHRYLVPQPVAQELLWQVDQWWRGPQGGRRCRPTFHFLRVMVMVMVMVMSGNGDGDGDGDEWKC